MQPKLVHRGGFDAGGTVGLFFVRGVNDLDVVGLMTRHHLIAGDAFEYGVHDGPLWCGFLPTTPGFGIGKFDDFSHANVAMQGVVFHKDATPDNVTGFADAFYRAAS
jgi:hypothetical protein